MFFGIKKAMPVSYGAQLIIMGILILTQSYFIISISENTFLWWQVIHAIDKSPLNLVVSYVMAGWAIWLIVSGIVIWIISDPEAELKPQKMIKILSDNKENPKIYYKFMYIMLTNQFVFTGILLGLYFFHLTNNLIDLILTSLIFIMFTSAMVFLVKATLSEKREKSTSN